MQIFAEAVPPEQFAGFVQQQSYTGIMQQLPGPLASGGSTWLKGMTWLATLKQQENVSKPFDVIGWSLVLHVYIVVGYLGNDTLWHYAAPYGRLPEMLAGIVLNDYEYNGVYQGVPRDMTGIDRIFEPESDECFPMIDRPTNVQVSQRPLIHTFNLPQPVTVNEGDTLQFGFWSLPHLIANAGIRITDLAYSVMYNPNPHS